jgi:hypothetical protein
LHIIGFEVDPNAMTVTMDADAHIELIELIRSFAVAGKKRTLKEFQQIAGHVNWAPMYSLSLNLAFLLSMPKLPERNETWLP